MSQLNSTAKVERWFELIEPLQMSRPGSGFVSYQDQDNEDGEERAILEGTRSLFSKLSARKQRKVLGFKLVLCGVGVDFAVHHHTTGYYLIASSVLVFWLEVTWVITLFLQLCVRTENNRMWRCWQGVVWLNGWKKTLVYGSLGAIPLIWPHKLWLAYVAGGQLIALAVFHLLLSFKGRRRRKRKDRLLNGDIDSFESSRFEEVTEVLDDGLPEPIPGSSHSLSDSLAEPDTILEI